jgi:hypothetical protein
MSDPRYDEEWELAAEKAEEERDAQADRKEWAQYDDD